MDGNPSEGDLVYSNGLNRRLLQFNPNGTITFFDVSNNEIGRLVVRDNMLTFEGNADKSAEVFLSAVVELVNRGWWRKS